jgi:hypothetical protein
MQYENGLWKVTIDTQDSWGSLDFVFTNGSVWDNNGWRDYHLYLGPSSVPAGVSNLLTGDETSWGSYLPAPDSGGVHNGEYVWSDASGDEHVTMDYPWNGSDYDLRSVRLRTDSNYVYFSIKMANLSALGEFGAPLIAIPINTGSGANHTIPYDGSLSYSPGWDYWVVVDLSRAGFPDAEMVGSPAVTVYNSSFSELTGNCYAIVSRANDVIQVAVPKALIGDPSSLSFNVLVFLGDSRGGALNPGSPKVVDLISPSSTDDELSDGTINYAASVDLTAVPFFGNFAVVAVLLAALVFVFRRR